MGPISDLGSLDLEPKSLEVGILLQEMQLNPQKMWLRKRSQLFKVMRATTHKRGQAMGSQNSATIQSSPQTQSATIQRAKTTATP